MNNNILLSIIIPLYNQEKLIIKALNSIPKKDNIEIIVIDDASTDNSLNIIKNYNYPIKIFTNKFNEGPGDSRNVGLDNANGKYIMFLDSDDYIFTEEYQKIEKIMFEDKYDVIFYNLETNNGHIVDVTKDNPKACGTIKIIKREFIGKLRFPLISKAEDKYFHKWLMDKKPKVYHSHIKLVHYNYPREGSITNIFKTIDKKIKANKDYKYLVEATPLYQEKKIADKETETIPIPGERWFVDKRRLDILMWDNIYEKCFVYLIGREDRLTN